MKVRDTKPGGLYAVSSEIGCTAINKAMAVDIPAGGQSVLLALDKKIILDGDDNAKFIEVRWGNNTPVSGRPVPAWLSDVLAGLVYIVGDENFDIEYIPDENKLVVHTDRVSDARHEAVTAMLERFVPKDLVVEQYNHHIEISPQDINKYASCKNRTDMVAVNPDYKLDLPSDGEWAYPLPSLTNADSLFEGSYVGNYVYVEGSSPVKKIDMTLPNLTRAYRMFAWCEVESVRLNAPKLDNFQFWACINLKTVEITGSPTSISFTGTGGITVVKISDTSKITNTVHAYDCAQKLEEFPLSYPALSSAANMFRDCKLSPDQVIPVLDSLPTWTDGKTHEIGLGIHVDHKNDEEVLAAISNTEAKGWTLTVKWNGTPTSAASTMAMGQLIYAKVGERELPDGTHEQHLDWWHYVTDPTGYETFRSLKSAYEYFGLEEPPIEEELQIEEIENA